MASKSKSNLFDLAVKVSSNAKRGSDKGIINKKAESTVTVKDTGTVSLSSGMYAQMKCDKESGVTSEKALQSFLSAVQREMTINDLIINRHKFNTQLFEFTNFKYNRGTAMGDLMVNTTMLVKAWDSTLQQFVLIRRPAYFSVFGNVLTGYTVDDRLELSEDMSEDFAEMKRTLNEYHGGNEDTDEEGGEE